MICLIARPDPHFRRCSTALAPIVQKIQPEAECLLVVQPRQIRLSQRKICLNYPSHPSPSRPATRRDSQRHGRCQRKSTMQPTAGIGQLCRLRYPRSHYPFAGYRAGSKSSIGFPSGSSIWICRPPGPTSISFRKRSPAFLSASIRAGRSAT